MPAGCRNNAHAQLCVARHLGEGGSCTAWRTCIEPGSARDEYIDRPFLRQVDEHVGVAVTDAALFIEGRLSPPFQCSVRLSDSRVDVEVVAQRVLPHQQPALLALRSIEQSSWNQ
jgi:hypothetical protein